MSSVIISFFSFGSNDCAACVFRSSNLFHRSKWQHQLQLSTSGFDNSDDDGAARRHSLGLVPVRQYPAPATRDIRLVSEHKPQRRQKQHVCEICDNLRCSISSMMATSTLAGDININSAHLFQRFSTFTSSSVCTQLERQHHQHPRSSSTAAQPQRSATVTARAFAAASFSSAPVWVFVSTSVEQQRTFQQQHTSRSQLSDQRHAPRLHFSFGV
jgi:hypothetical protein